MVAPSDLVQELADAVLAHPLAACLSSFSRMSFFRSSRSLLVADVLGQLVVELRSCFSLTVLSLTLRRACGRRVC